MNLLEVVVETPRLVLRPAHPDAAPDSFREFTAEVTRHMYPQPAKRIEETLGFIADARSKMAAGEELVMFIFRRDTDEFLGAVGMHRLDGETPEAGIWIKIPAHGNGYGLEAVEWLSRWTAEHYKPRHIRYPAMVENERSRRIPERLGGKLVRHFKQSNAAGVMRDLVEYIIPVPLPETAPPTALRPPA